MPGHRADRRSRPASRAAAREAVAAAGPGPDGGGAEPDPSHAGHADDPRGSAHGHAPSHGHGHGHSHGPPPDLEVARGPRLALLTVLAVVAAAVVVGAVLLWPDRGEVDKLQGSVGFTAPGVTYPSARVDAVQPACPVKGGNQTQAAGCGHLTVTVSGARTQIDVPPEVSAVGLSVGDHVQLTRTPGQGGQAATYAYFGIERAPSLWLLAALFVVVVVAVGRLRGLMALVGLAVAAAVVGLFVLPALLTGERAVPVALVGGAAIMYVVLYATHGVSLRTSAALAGTLGGIVVTALLAWWAVGSAHLTGVVDESGGLLSSFAGDLDLQDLLVAAVVLAGLGVLNDVTITQASAVWELRAAAPDLGRGRLFTSAMRIGRDHIASAIYTLAFVYVGAALTTLLVISLYDRSWLDLVGTEEIAEEIVRSLVGSIGLVLAVPITTAIAVLTVPGPREAWLAQDA